VKRGVCGVVELTVGDSDKGRRRRSRGRCGWWISIGTEVRVGGLGGDSSTAVVEEGEGGGPAVSEGAVLSSRKPLRKKGLSHHQGRRVTPKKPHQE
jgi:hypothetical protein